MSDRLVTAEKQPSRQKAADCAPKIRSSPGFWGRGGWQFWLLLLLVGSGGGGVYAVDWLVRLPALQDCETVVWKVASATKRLYCAQQAAQTRDLDGYLKAIALVEDLPGDHPLRPDIDAEIALWARGILFLAEQKFQQGSVKSAIDTAQKVPPHLKAYELVEGKIAGWQDVWGKASDIEAQALEHINNAHWNLAYRSAIELTEIRNEYWASFKYGQTIETIELARKDRAKLAELENTVERGNIRDLLNAIAEADKMPKESFFYDDAQALVDRIGDRLVDRARLAVDRRDWSTVIDTARAIPARLKRADAVEDLEVLARAGLQARIGTISGLEDAIASAQRLESDSPVYADARQLVGLWQQEISGIRHLSAARQIAASGYKSDLQGAIAEARKVSANNPRYREAQREIWQWSARIETLEDRPILNQAENLARARTLTGWRQAIAVAGQIGPQRSLYREAQSKIAEWRTQVQRTEDQPILNRALQLARGGDLENAIAIAEQIQPGRVLYPEARHNIRRWRDRVQRTEDQPILARATQLASRGDFADAIAAAEQIQPGRSLYTDAQVNIRRWRVELRARDSLASAYEAARGNAVSDLAAAIRYASQVPESASVYAESSGAIDRWSNQLFAIAIDRSQFDPLEAIKIAELVPRRSYNYRQVQQQMTEWRRELAPPEPPQIEIEVEPPSGVDLVSQ